LWWGLEPVVADKEARQYISAASLSALAGEQLQIVTVKAVSQVVKSGRRRTAESETDRFREAPARTKSFYLQNLERKKREKTKEKRAKKK